MNLREKTTFGMVWVSITSWSAQIITLGTSIVLARLLEPKDFGLVALSTIIVSLCKILSQSGFGGALIQRQNIDQKSTDTAFFLNTSLGLFLSVIVFLSAPLSVVFFKESKLVPILRYMSVNILIASLIIVPSNLLEREMAFKKKSWIELLQSISYSIVAISGAILGWGVWSLVVGSITSLSIQAIMIWDISKYRPKIYYDKKIALELWGFGKHLLLASLLLFAVGNADSVYIGRFLAVASVGIYGLAMNYSDLPTDFLGRLFNRVMFPTFAQVQLDSLKLKSIYLTSLRYISYAAFPISFGLYAIADPTIRLIYGEKWLASIPLVHILCFYGLFRSLGNLTVALFSGIGKPDISVRILLLRISILGVLIFFLGYQFKLAGVATAMSFSMIITVLLSFVIINRYLSIDYLSLLKEFLPQLIAAMIMFAIIQAFALLPITPLYQLAIFIPSGVLTYILFVWLFTRGRVKEDFILAIKPITAQIRLFVSRRK